MAWLEGLYEAHAADPIPYIESLAEPWGELCGSKPLASEWADQLIDVTRLALSPDKDRRGFLQGTSACWSTLLAAERYAEGCWSPWASDNEIDTLCEEMLLASGLDEEAYRRYGLTANRRSTYLAWCRAV